MGCRSSIARTMITGMTSRPPTMSELLKDEYFRGMMHRNIVLPSNLTSSTLSPPFALWRLTDDSRWQRGQYQTYAEAFAAMRRQLARDNTLDVAIVSKRKMFPPPIGFKWNQRHFSWCARCRRPSTFRLRYTHHALRGVETTMDESVRCFYCGIRQVALPRYKPR